MEEKTYKIAAHYLKILEKDIQKLAKRAAKLGIGTVSMVVEREVMEPEPVSVNAPIQDNVKFRRFVIVRVEGEAPKLNGWTFVGTLQRWNGDKLIIRTAPDQEMPTEYRNANPDNCDHCKTARLRKDTFVVRHDNGTHKQVGRQCLADFLGHKSPEAVAKYVELLGLATSAVGEAEENGWGDGEYGMRMPHVYDLRWYLAYVALAIEEHGWTSKTAAKEAEQLDYLNRIRATADIANEMMNPAPSTPTHERKVAEKRHLELADKAIAWAKKIDRDNVNDYLYNLWLIADSEYTDDKNMGFSASMINAYTREMSRQREQAKRTEENKDSDYIGEIGKRIQITATVEAIINLGHGDYGECYLFKFRTTDGDVAAWFTTAGNDFELDRTYEMKGTVKKHEEYQGIKQTQLNRCKMIAPVEPATA